MSLWDDVNTALGVEVSTEAADSTAGGSGVTWSGMLPTTPLRDLVTSGIRLRLDYDWWSQLATAALGDPMSFSDGVDAYAAAMCKESGGGFRVAARAYVRDDDNAAFVDLSGSGTEPANISVRELVARVDRGAYACQLTAVSRRPTGSDAQRNDSLLKERDNANPSAGANGGSGGSTLPDAVGIPKPKPGFWDQFGKYSGLVVGLAGALVILYVAHNTVE